MASSTTSLEEKDLTFSVRQSVQHKPSTTRTRQERQRTRSKAEQQQRGMCSNAVPIASQNADPNGDSKLANKSPSNKANRHNRRNLRERRRATGIFNVQSTESTGGTSSGEEYDDEYCVKKNTLLNELIVTASEEQENDKEEEKEDVLQTNEYLREQIRLKDEYIKKLEQKVRRLQLELQQNHSNSNN